MMTTRGSTLDGVIVLPSLALSTAGCTDAEKPVIDLHVREGTDSHWLNNTMAEFFIENGYGYPVETVVETTSVLLQALPRGEVDLNLEDGSSTFLIGTMSRSRRGLSSTWAQ